jgi:hypothetical protein
MKEQSWFITLFFGLMKLFLTKERYWETRADATALKPEESTSTLLALFIITTILSDWLERFKDYFNTSPGSYIEGLYLWKEKAIELCGYSIIFLIFAGFLKQEWLINLIAVPLLGSVYICISIDWWLEQKRIFRNLIWPAAICLFFFMLFLCIIFYSDPEIYKAAVIHTARYAPYFPENMRVIGLVFTHTLTISSASCAALALIYAIFGLVPGIYTSVYFFRKYTSKI